MGETTANIQPEEEMTADYANNTMFEPTVWDLKLIFGEYSQRAQSVEYHTSITIPWAQAKLLSYFLQANITAHEINFGKITIPNAVMPPEWIRPTLDQAQDPKTVEVFEALQKLRAQFVENLKP
jgi:hypothetical protein